jgi:hypothetical protein
MAHALVVAIVSRNVPMCRGDQRSRLSAAHQHYELSSLLSLLAVIALFATRRLPGQQPTASLAAEPAD